MHEPGMTDYGVVGRFFGRSGSAASSVVGNSRNCRFSLVRFPARMNRRVGRKSHFAGTRGTAVSGAGGRCRICRGLAGSRGGGGQLTGSVRGSAFAPSARRRRVVDQASPWLRAGAVSSVSGNNAARGAGGLARSAKHSLRATKRCRPRLFVAIEARGRSRSARGRRADEKKAAASPRGTSSAPFAPRGNTRWQGGGNRHFLARDIGRRPRALDHCSDIFLRLGRIAAAPDRIESCAPS